MYKEFSQDTVREYVKSNVTPEYLYDDLEVKEIEGGKVNQVFSITYLSNKKSFIVKQALPYLKIAGTMYPLTIERNRIEYEAIKVQEHFNSGFVPEIFYHDHQAACFAMKSYVPMRLLKEELIGKARLENLAKQIGEYIARTLFFTSYFGIKSKAYKCLMTQFINTELSQMKEQILFSMPYKKSLYTVIDPSLKKEIYSLWKDKKFLTEIDYLHHIYLTKNEALIHGDFHTSAILAGEDKWRVIDYEFATYGPISVDLGSLIADYIFNCWYWKSIETPENIEVKGYLDYLISSIRDIWLSFEKEFISLNLNKSVEQLLVPDSFLKNYMKELLQETIKFSSNEILQRLISGNMIYELEQISNSELKCCIKKKLFFLSYDLLINGNEIQSIDDFISWYCTDSINI